MYGPSCTRWLFSIQFMYISVTIAQCIFTLSGLKPSIVLITEEVTMSQNSNSIIKQMGLHAKNVGKRKITWCQKNVNLQLRTSLISNLRKRNSNHVSLKGSSKKNLAHRYKNIEIHKVRGPTWYCNVFCCRTSWLSNHLPEWTRCNFGKISIFIYNNKLIFIWAS